MSYWISFMVIGLMCWWAQARANICYQRPEHDRMQVVSDVSKYIECVYGQPIEKSCENGKTFNATSRSCKRETIVGFECPSDSFFVDLPVDYECSQFIRCLNGKATQHTCDSDLLFDPILRQCNNKKSVICACPTIDIDENYLFVRDWSDCSKYHVCANGTIAASGQCSTNLHFDLVKKQCVKNVTSRSYDYDQILEYSSQGVNCGDKSTSI